MILFYPTSGICTPIIIADMLDSSDRWSTVEALNCALSNKPDDVTAVLAPIIYSCKYNYSVQHNGIPLGSSLKMSLRAVISSPPSELIARVSVNYVASAESISQMSDVLAAYVNPQFKVLSAVVVERTPGGALISRAFVAYSVILQPDTHGTNATLFIKGASFNDVLIRAECGFQLDTTIPLSTQLTTLCTTLDYSCIFDVGVATSVPVSGRLFQPTSFSKILDEICLQNKIIPEIDESQKIIRFYAQNAEPAAAAATAKYTFSFLGYGKSALMWGVGVENYTNVKFKTSIFDAKLFNKITLYNDSQSALFEGFNKASPKIGTLIPVAYNAYILRYTIDRNNSELCCGVTATNNWLLAQIRIDGILESKIFGGLL